MVNVRNSVRDVCLVGCLGEEIAGKTTLIRTLLGLDIIPNAYENDKATEFVAGTPMPVHTAHGLRAVRDSPGLVDTPGMFDANQERGDCAIKHMGEWSQTCLILNM